MKVLFINPSVGYYTRALSNPLGLLSIATHIKNNGHEVKLEDRCVHKVNINKLLDSFKPDIVGVSLMSSRGLIDAEKISKAARAKGIPVVWGGQMPSLQMEQVLDLDLVDYISYGEGEETWLEMARNYDVGLSFDDIRGLAFVKNGEYIETEKRELMELSVLPKLDWNLINPCDYFQTGYGCKNQVHIYYSKGCIGNCSFCYNNQYNCSVRRQRPLDYVIEEMRLLAEKYGADGFEFTDDLMFSNRAQMLEFCTKIIHKREGECPSATVQPHPAKYF